VVLFYITRRFCCQGSKLSISAYLSMFINMKTTLCILICLIVGCISEINYGTNYPGDGSPEAWALLRQAEGLLNTTTKRDATDHLLSKRDSWNCNGSSQCHALYYREAVKAWQRYTNDHWVRKNCLILMFGLYFVKLSMLRESPHELNILLVQCVYITILA
jgi:hypothetical protein